MQLVVKEQRQDKELARLTDYLNDNSLPSDPGETRQVVSQAQKGYILFNRWSVVS